MPFCSPTHVASDWYWTLIAQIDLWLSNRLVNIHHLNLPRQNFSSVFRSHQDPKCQVWKKTVLFCRPAHPFHCLWLMCMSVPMYIPHQRCERKCVMEHPSTCRRNSKIPCHLLYVIRYHDTIILLCSTKILIARSRKPERKLPTSTNHVQLHWQRWRGWRWHLQHLRLWRRRRCSRSMQSEWDEDTSTTTKKRKFKTAYQLSPVTVEKKNWFC